MLDERDERREDDAMMLAHAVAYGTNEPEKIDKMFKGQTQVERGDVVWWGKGPEAARAAVLELFADEPDPVASAPDP